MIKKVVTIVLTITAIVTGLIASSVKEMPEWWEITRPFFIIYMLSIFVAMTINNFNYIRRIIYPVFVCICAWAYQHKIVTTKFTQSTYKVFKWKNKSYKKLFGYTQDLFDAMYM